MQEPTIKIPIGDWVEEWQRSPIKPKNRDDIIAAMLETPMRPTEAARLALAGRHLGEADEDILPPNKVTLMLGGAHEISQMIARQKVDVSIKDRTFEARQYVGGVPKEDDNGTGPQPGGDGRPLVELHGSEAVERAKQYLFSKVPGHIWSRLLIIAANGEDVEVVGEELKSKIDEMVSRLV